jgi:hypothetical protein
MYWKTGIFSFLHNIMRASDAFEDPVLAHKEELAVCDDAGFWTIYATND